MGDLLRRERTLNATASSPHWPSATGPDAISPGRAGGRDEILIERMITFLLFFWSDE